jgi:hypothetical protein
MVIIYFGGFALLWSAIAASLFAGRDLAAHDSVLPLSGAHPYLIPGIVALALHAAVVVLSHGRRIDGCSPMGRSQVVVAGAPLIALIDNLWFVPAFLYLIAVLHVWLASLHESHGRLQASQSHSRSPARDSAPQSRSPVPPARAGGSRA